jgi:hypothetical protein
MTARREHLDGLDDVVDPGRGSFPVDLIGEAQDGDRERHVGFHGGDDVGPSTGWSCVKRRRIRLRDSREGRERLERLERSGEAAPVTLVVTPRRDRCVGTRGVLVGGAGTAVARFIVSARWSWLGRAGRGIRVATSIRPIGRNGRMV